MGKARGIELKKMKLIIKYDNCPRTEGIPCTLWRFLSGYLVHYGLACIASITAIAISKQLHRFGPFLQPNQEGGRRSAGAGLNICTLSTARQLNLDPSFGSSLLDSV
ncbi:hypothetical protein NE237_019235 [Protea cynaroides]|uniref:Uncharacterized protein n=1 Tax=Protea cynaroides TaxID=273540 RepID=A0A9Q0KBM2_9MAGN|nr:hypothetical protein NE237_019235 [Protea cynaroides]